MRTSAVLSVAFLLLAAVIARSDEKPRYEDTFRNLSVSVPKLAKAPTIDGTVDAAEWRDAAMAPRFVMLDDGEGHDRLTGEEKKIYWGYTDGALYLAFQIQRPAGLPVECARNQV